jgi:hypothetical protein
MADHPKAKDDSKQIISGDRTGAVVAGGIVLLALAGAGTIFFDAITAALSPATSVNIQNPD